MTTAFMLPPITHRASELFDVGHLVEMLAQPTKIPTFAGGLDIAKRMFADPAVGIQKVAIVVLRANDNLQLIEYGPRGGHMVVWDFGTVNEAVKYRKFRIAPDS